MKTQLIMLDTPIIVSDEEIRSKDWYITNLSNIYQETERMFEDDEGKPRFHYPQYKKILAGIEGLPSIDWNGLEEEFEWVDVDLNGLCYYDKRNPYFSIKEEYGFGREEIENTGDFAGKDCACNNCFYGRSLLTEQIIKLKSLNDKKFSLEDMFKCFQAGIDYEKEGIILQPDAHGYIYSLQQPKVFEIEIEMYRPNGAYQISEHWSPKIENDSIKIIRKI